MEATLPEPVAGFMNFFAIFQSSHISSFHFYDWRLEIGLYDH
jgi:hypothetical protein